MSSTPGVTTFRAEPTLETIKTPPNQAQVSVIIPALNESRRIAEVVAYASNVLQRFLSDTTAPAVEETWAIGDNLNDLELLRLANRAYVIDPKSSALTQEPRVTEIKSFEELLD